MSDTAQLFILAGVWAVIALFIARLPRSWVARFGLYLVLIGVPFWELPIGYYNFKTLCTNQSGLHIVESIAPQELVCVEYPFDSAAQDFLNYGFKGVEAKDAKGAVVTFHKSDLETTATEKSRGLSSHYCVTYSNNIQQSWRVLRHDFLVIRTRDRFAVARHSIFDWAGMWWQASMSPIFGRGGTCREDPIGPIANLLRTGGAVR